MTVDALADLGLSYTPPLGSPWDAVQIAAQTWTRDHHRAASVSRSRTAANRSRTAAAAAIGSDH